jgi:hypothetical protein
LLRSSGSSNDTGYSGPVSDGGSAYGSSGFQYGDTDKAVATPCTFEAWFFHDYLATAFSEIINAQIPGGFSIGLRVSNGGVLQGLTSGGALNSATAWTKQAWHHCVLALAAGGNFLYLDGAQVATNVVGAFAQNLNFGVGCKAQNPPIETAIGFVAEAAFYASQLSAARVLAHFNAADQTGQPPVASAAGGLTGSGPGSANYQSILQQILSAVRHTFPTT